jgi:hypothetical protein
MSDTKHTGAQATKPIEHIERSWEEFRRLCIRRKLTAAEADELRQTFFAGASMMFQGLANASAGSTARQERDNARLLIDLHSEVARFTEALGDLRLLGFRRNITG